MSWRKVKLKDFCRIEKGLIGIQKAIQGQYPLVVTGEERKTHNEYQFDDEAVIIPLVSSTGHGDKSLKRIHFQSGKFALGSILCAIIPNNKNELNPEYLYRFLDLNKENELVSRMKGMANVALPMKEIGEIEIPLPSIDEQLQFVQNYNQLEGQSNQLSLTLTHQLDLVRQLRQAFLREAMQGKLVPQNPDDEPATVLLEKIKTEKLNRTGFKPRSIQFPPIKTEEIPFEIPENWVWCRFEILGDCRLGKMLDINKNKGSLVKYVRNTNIQWNKIDLDDIKLIRLEDKEIEEFKLLEGDLLICEGGIQGRCAIWKEQGKYFAFQKAIHRFRTNGVVLAKLVEYYLTFSYNNEFLSNFFTGNQIKHLTGDSLKKLPFPLPPLPEQQRIVAKLDELMALCDGLEASIKAGQQQNEALLQQVLREALRGEEVDV